MVLWKTKPHLRQCNLRFQCAAGRSWTAEDLRKKSWDDLHKLWYVLLKERNLLLSERDRYRAAGQIVPNGRRITKVLSGVQNIPHLFMQIPIHLCDVQQVVRAVQLLILVQ